MNYRVSGTPCLNKHPLPMSKKVKNIFVWGLSTVQDPSCIWERKRKLFMRKCAVEKAIKKRFYEISFNDCFYRHIIANHFSGTSNGKTNPK